MIYFDIGAYGEKQFPFGDEKALKFIKKFIAVDPRYKEEVRTCGKTTYHNYGIFDEEVTKTFYIARDKKQNSIFPCDYEISKIFKYPKQSWVEKEISLTCKKLSTLIEKYGGDIDILKLDVHGSEYNILKEIESTGDLKKIIAVQVEMWFIPMYIGAVLGDKIHKFLSSNFFSPSLMMGGKITAWKDILYLNNKTEKLDKMELIKKLYNLNSQKKAKAEKIIYDLIEKMEG